MGRLAELADVLVARHLQVSWPQPQDTACSWFDTDDRLPGYHSELRTVAVVGAGASIPIVSVADELADRLEEEYGGERLDREAELDRLEQVYGLDRTHFETRLFAICRTTEAERKVRAALSEDYRFRHPNLLTYELLAHLLKHRFLDAIVSFNFDELLDQSIEDELGPNEYTRVVTERDWDPDYPVDSPLYVKMHGTASEPESLRFTGESYYWTPKSIIGLVENQFDVEHLVVLNLGFRMASFDFQYLLRMPGELQIYHLDPRPLTRDVLAKIREHRKKERERRGNGSPASYDRPEVESFHLRNPDRALTTFLEDRLRNLASRMEARATTPAAGPAHWRRVVRHEAAVKLLKGFNTGEQAHYVNYLRRRTILELAFTAAKGRGVVSIAAMVNERCGLYYDLYRRAAGAGVDTWSKLCHAGGLVEISDSPDTYEVLDSVRAAPSPTALRIPRVHRLQLVNPGKLADHVLKSMDPDPGGIKSLTKLLRDTLEFLQKETEVEVHSRDDRVCSKVFTRPVILTTLTAFEGWTKVMLDTGDYDELWIIAETGQWLEELDFRKRLQEKKHMRLLVAFGGWQKSRRNIEVRRIPWWRHNRHMTILCRNGQPQSATYFVRRLRASTVTPVYLTDGADLKRLANAFELLWADAEPA